MTWYVVQQQAAVAAAVAEAKQQKIEDIGLS
jgi:hypothetical protein